MQAPDTLPTLPASSLPSTTQSTQGDSELRSLLSLAAQSPQLVADPEVMSMLLRTLTMKLQQSPAPSQ